MTIYVINLHADIFHTNKQSVTYLGFCEGRAPKARGSGCLKRRWGCPPPTGERSGLAGAMPLPENFSFNFW